MTASPRHLRTPFNDRLDEVAQALSPARETRRREVTKWVFGQGARLCQLKTHIIVINVFNKVYSVPKRRLRH